MSLAALDWAFRLPLKGPRKAVLLALANHADEQGRCYPGLDRLALYAGVDQRSARRALRELETVGAIATEQSKGRHHSSYALDLSFTAPMAPPQAGPAAQQARPNGHDTRTESPGSNPPNPDRESVFTLANPVTESGLTRSESPGSRLANSGQPGQRVRSTRTESPPNLHRTVRKKEERPSVAPPRAPTRPRERTALPEGWQPNAAGERYAAERGVPLDQVAAFANHHTAVGSRMADWNAAWRTWVDRAPQFARNRGERRNGWAQLIEEEGMDCLRDRDDGSETDEAFMLRIVGHA